MEESAKRITQRVRPWHKYGSEYLQGTAEELKLVMCDWPSFMHGNGHVWLTWFMNEKGFPPFLEIFSKNVLQKIFNKDIEMS
jgi:hypothetical protein